MKKTLITLADVRQALVDSISGPAQQKTPTLSDEQLLKTDLVNDFKMDSLELVELTMHLEHDLRITISDEMFSAFKTTTVAHLIDCCNRYATENM